MKTREKLPFAAMTRHDIRKLYQKYQTPKHIQRHMRQVAKVAVFIGKKFMQNGTKLDLSFIKNLALLHDFLKMLVFQESKKTDPKIWKQLRKKFSKKHDTEVAAQILKKIGKQKLARSISTQQFDAVISKKHPLKTWEEKIVYYADKRVAHDKIVSLKERLEEGSKRYKTRKQDEKRITSIHQKIAQLERLICKKAKIRPKAITDEKLKNVS